MKNGKPLPLDVKSISFEGPPITWSGECPWVNGSEKGFAFGTEDGCVWFSPIERRSGKPAQAVVPSGEAINGLAFSGKVMAASTRAEVVIEHFDELGGPKRSQTIYEGGAHGVVATAHGGMIAPLGPMGLLLVEPDEEGHDRHREIRAEGSDLYYYKVASFGLNAEGVEIFACAGRTDGIIAVEIEPKGQPGRIVNSRGQNPSEGIPLDMIDLCPLKTPEHPYAVASLGIDGSLHLSRDLFRGWSQIALHFDSLAGTPYSVHVANGHVFIHTSEAVYFMPELATRFLQGQNLVGRMFVPSFPCDAIDCSIAYDEHLLLTLGRTVQVISIRQWFASKRRDEDAMTADQPTYAWEQNPSCAVAAGLVGSR